MGDQGRKPWKHSWMQFVTTWCWIRIPNEGWVHQIWENAKNSCSIVNLKTGVSQQCVWQKNHTILRGTTIKSGGSKNKLMLTWHTVGTNLMAWSS
jgi:hypothetical protein